MTHQTGKWWWLPGGLLLFGAFCFSIASIPKGKTALLVIGLSLFACGLSLMIAAKAHRAKQQSEAVDPECAHKGSK
jgi:predicted phage tail protein